MSQPSPAIETVVTREASLVLLGSVNESITKAQQMDVASELDTQLVEHETAKEYKIHLGAAANLSHQLCILVGVTNEMEDADQMTPMQATASELGYILESAHNAAQSVVTFAQLVVRSGADDDDLPTLLPTSAFFVQKAQTLLQRASIFAPFLADMFDADARGRPTTYVRDTLKKYDLGVGVDNVLSLLELAHKQNAKGFFKSLAAFFFAHQKDVRDTEEWENMKQQNPKLATKIMESALDSVE